MLLSAYPKKTEKKCWDLNKFKNKTSNKTLFNKPPCTNNPWWCNNSNKWEWETDTDNNTTEISLPPEDNNKEDSKNLKDNIKNSLNKEAKVSKDNTTTDKTLTDKEDKTSIINNNKDKELLNNNKANNNKDPPPQPLNL